MTIRFTLDGEKVTARKGETIWQVARRRGTEIPHLCYRPEPGYRPDGNCRLCMVEIEGERMLSPSCHRQPTQGMVVNTQSERAQKARRMVLELLLADQPARQASPDHSALIWRWADELGLHASRFDRRARPEPDRSHPAIAFNPTACIDCTLCIRACREVQNNGVIGMAGRGAEQVISFDCADPLAASTCVACGECVAACPTGALMPAALVDENGHGSRESDAQIRSVCPYCGVGCQITYHLREGRIAFVEGADGPANRNRLCVKGRFGFDYITHPHRLTMPLIRRPDTPKGMDVDPGNPLSHFRAASWEEALDVAAAGLAGLRDRHGGRAVAGFGSAKCSNEEAYLFQKLIRLGFGHNSVDHCTRLCHASSVAALMEGIGSGAVTAPFTDCLKADVIITIGTNSAENHPVAATWFKQAVKGGTRLIVLDPRGHALRHHADPMVQFRPGTDVALLNAMMQVIVAEELYDRDYIAAHTSDFESMKAHLAAYVPEKMAPICGVDAGLIRTIARHYAKADRAMIFWGMGVSQHVHGTDNARCLIALALMCGHVGRPGTGLHPLRGQNNVQGASDAGLIPMVFPDYRKVNDAAAREKLLSVWGALPDDQPGLTVVEIINAIHDGTIRGMYIMGENPAMSDPDVGHARAALAKLEHLVVQDIFLTETAMFADVVLPATAWPEKTGTVTNSNRQIQMGRKAVEPPGQARPDWQITQALARRLGLDWDHGGPESVFAEMKQVMASLDHISWQRLETESIVTYPCDGPDQPGNAVVFGDGFPTEDGKARFVPASIIAPDELPDENYPLILTTGRQLEHWHTGAMTRRSVVLDALEPAASVYMHPATLAAYKLKAGDRIAVSSRRGRIELQARTTPGMQEDLIFIPFAYVEAAANLLTNPKLDPYGKIPEFKFCAVKIEPVS